MVYFARKRHVKKWRPKATDILAFVLVIVIAGFLAWRTNQHIINPPAPVYRIEGRAAISDGDSIRIHGQRIRIVGIDAPELGQYCEKDGRQFACGQQSAEHLRSLVGNRPVKCTWIEKDRYNRILGYCFAGETDLNRTMVMDGWAISYNSYPREEREARKHKRGLWQWKFQRPHEWRRAHPRQDIPLPERTSPYGNKWQQ